MKPLSIEGQVKILEKVLHSPVIYGMCILISKYSGNNYFEPKFSPEKLIPSFNHQAYLRFYPNVKVVQEIQNELY